MDSRKSLLSDGSLSKIMSVGAFIIFAASFVVIMINYTNGNEDDIYLILGIGGFTILTSMFLGIKTLKVKDFSIERSVEGKVSAATKEELETKEEWTQKKETQETETKSPHDTSIHSEDHRARRERVEKVKRKVLETYSSKHNFRQDIKLSLDEPDPIANIEHLIFDGFYNERKRDYCILISWQLGYNLARYYRDLRIITDISFRMYHRRVILRIAYIKKEADDRMLKRFQNYFRLAIEDDHLKIDFFNEEGEKIDE